jgi:hypothetical protein
MLPLPPVGDILQLMSATSGLKNDCGPVKDIVGSSHVISPCGPGILGGMLDWPRSTTASLQGCHLIACYQNFWRRGRLLTS